MIEVAEELILIDNHFPGLLRALESALGVAFSTSELERSLSEAQSDRRSEKRYTFFDGASFSVTGQVDEYEPETIWIRVRGRGAKALLQELIQQTP